MEQSKKRNKGLIAIVLAVCLVAAGVIGTVAWLTASNSVTNTFTNGGITPPTTDPTDPGEPISISGNIYEPSWVDKSPLLADAAVAKDPYVGIGPNSPACYVFVGVENNTVKSGISVDSANAAYFTLEEGWVATSEATNSTADGHGTDYVEGLFAYGSDGSTPVLTTLEKTDADENRWTQAPLFSTVTLPTGATADDGANIVVKCFIYAPTNGETAADALTAAKAWYDGGMDTGISAGTN